MEKYDLHSEFNIEMHKKTFINYLEVLIEPDGHVLYAIPSHQELAIKLACKKNNWTRDELNKNCPPDYYFDFLPWILGLTECISVWNDFYQGTANDKQIAKLRELKNAGLYRGIV